jgi:hypothetical protein
MFDMKETCKNSIKLTISLVAEWQLKCRRDLPGEVTSPIYRTRSYTKFNVTLNFPASPVMARDLKLILYRLRRVQQIQSGRCARGVHVAVS